ncbi:MAG: AI-2E family transporter, partial [Chloroflexota bacterium]
HVAAEDAVVQPLDHATERALGDVVTEDRGTYSVDAAGGLAQSRRPVPGRAGTDRNVARVAAPTPRVALTLAAAVLILLVLFAAFDSVRPFVLGLVLVYLLAPAVDRLAASGVPRALAVLAVFVGVIAVLVAVATLALSPLIAQLSQFIDDLPSLVGGVRGSVEDFYAGLNLTPDVRAIVDRTLGSFGSGIGGISVGGVVGPIIGSVFGFLATLTAYAILPAWLFFVLRDRVRLADSLERSLPPEWRGDVFAVFAITNRVFGNWIRGQLVLGLIVGLASFVGLMILDRTVSDVFGRYAVLLAILAGVFELVPFIGPIIAAVPAVLIGLTAGPAGFLAALILYFAIQQLENNILVPKIQGDAVELHPAIVMTSLVIGAALAGILGAIISLPIAAASRDIFRYFFRRVSDPPATVEQALVGVSPKLLLAVRQSALEPMTAVAAPVREVA